MSLRRTQFYRVLHRPNLFLGGERQLVMFTLLICVAFGLTSMNLVIILVSAGIWILCIGLFRKMAQVDPCLSRVYIRHKKYQKYYPPNSRPARVDSLLRENRK
jgi:type IV secretion system protein TrbD